MEMAGLTCPIGMLIEYELSIFSMTEYDIFIYLAEDHILFSLN